MDILQAKMSAIFGELLTFSQESGPDVKLRVYGDLGSTPATRLKMATASFTTRTWVAMPTLCWRRVPLSPAA